MLGTGVERYTPFVLAKPMGISSFCLMLYGDYLDNRLWNSSMPDYNARMSTPW